MIIFTLSSCFVALEDLNSKSGSPKDYWSFILFQTYDSSSIKPVSGVKWVPVLNKLALIKTCNISWNVLNKITICQSQDKDWSSERPRWDTWEQNPISDIQMCFSAPWWLCLQFRLYNIKLNLANYFLRITDLIFGPMLESNIYISYQFISRYMNTFCKDSSNVVINNLSDVYTKHG